ncbi:MAG TPA: hypothetical protein VIG24_03895 [Acidimicrobiia bacterium]
MSADEFLKGDAPKYQPPQRPETTWRHTPGDDEPDHEQNIDAAYHALREAQKAVRKVIASACLIDAPKDIDDWTDCERHLRTALFHAEVNL